METEAYYAFHAHKNKVLMANKLDASEMRIALENLDERMQEFFGDVDEPKRRLLYMEIIACLNEGHPCKDAVYDYLHVWEDKLNG